VEMLSPADQRRRWFCTFFLILAGGLLLWGLTFLDRTLAHNPVLFLVYWFSCFVFTGLALVIAGYDMMIIRRRTREEHHQVFKKTFDDVTEDSPESPGNPERKGSRPE
jgi:hypothetical protein